MGLIVPYQHETTNPISIAILPFNQSVAKIRTGQYTTVMFARIINIPDYKSDHQLRLVCPDKNQATTTIEWITKNNVTQYLGADFTDVTIETEKNHLSLMQTDLDCYSWMIECGGMIVGNIEINDIKQQTQKYGTKAGSVCTLVGNPADWGKGLGSNAKQAVCNWAFREADFEIIEAKAYIQNERSWRALEKLGYAYTGSEKDNINGSPVIWKVYTLTKSVWANTNWAKQ